MRLTIKTTQQKVFHTDVELSDTIAILKLRIQESQGYPTPLQKIIYSGKILSDDKTIESCGIKEKDFLVLMVTKPKQGFVTNTSPSSFVPPSSSLSAASSENHGATEISNAASTEAQNAVSSTKSTTSHNDSGSGSMLTNSNAFLSGEALQTTVKNMVEMGFHEDQVIRALRASFNNPDRAVEYLMNGIPPHLDMEASGQSRVSMTGTSAHSGNPVSIGTPMDTPTSQNLFQLAQQQHHTSGNTNSSFGPTPQLDLAALRDNPQIQQLREHMSQNPAVVQPLIQQLASQNPAVSQILTQNPEALLQLLGVNEMDFEDDGGHIPSNTHVFSVTEEERAAIERLEALGFSRQAVLEAYFACDKNEELAANYLFESGFED
ncbi:hypothetical protein AMATHDRAFT_72109 [Amanita thiersii Skay4041]|uniref:UV excision repair protein RAD23 n=1 Tax=Amanita thiersii Skay4041 TaxID=703135 RepID=A0A2A9NB25_9AGAR|nr:hypothetical protein AMATHDRAFT_72109 [Amanita thiersii Skay4041]